MNKLTLGRPHSFLKMDAIHCVVILTMIVLGIAGASAQGSMVVAPAYSATLHNAMFGNGFIDPVATVSAVNGNPAMLSADSDLSGSTYTGEGGTFYKIHWSGPVNLDDFAVGSTISLHYDFTIGITASGAGGAVGWTVASVTNNVDFPQVVGTASDASTHIVGDLSETVNAPLTGTTWSVSLTFVWTGESSASRLSIDVPNTSSIGVSAAPAPEPASLSLIACAASALIVRRRRAKA
jgi:hypothetical protein